VYEWCLSLGIPVGTHLAESAAENEWLVSGTGRLASEASLLVEPTGLRGVATLEGVLGPELLCAHCVDLDEAEIPALARHDVPVAHCPRSNALLGCGIAPVADLRAAGVRVGLGTDSPASTPSFDVWEELRTAVFMSRAREQRPDALTATDALRLATLDSAVALGLADEVGSLTVGKRADLCVLSLAVSPYDPVEDPAVAAVFGGSPARVIETIVEGRTRYRQGETAWHEVHSTARAARKRMLA
jgi:5-methylthioadenosine/S-adenosylhomocysteine deaminase